MIYRGLQGVQGKLECGTGILELRATYELTDLLEIVTYVNQPRIEEDHRVLMIIVSWQYLTEDI